MAPEKRKAASDDRPSKKPRAETEDHRTGKDVAEKRSRKAHAEQDRKTGDKKDSDRKRGPIKSVLQEEERAFPRGGASVLTPIEHRQIKAQAERDVLFEQETGQKAEPTDDNGDNLFAEDVTLNASAKRKRKTTGRKSDSGLPEVEGSGVTIGSLSYKSVVVGSTVLGRVTNITAKDVALALPNNLTGYAPITALSEGLNARIEKLLMDDGESGDDEQDIDLQKLFYRGQWLRASVTATTTEPSEAGVKSKKHIQLSLDPASVNGGLADDNLPANTTVQAAVRSVEDHGLVMDVGLADRSVRGFVSKKDLGSAYTLSHVQEGQVMLCLVTGKGSNGKVLKLSPDFSKLNATLPGSKQPVVSDAPTVDAFLPGTAVEILITESGDRGVVGKIMGMLDVTADIVHSNAVHVEDMSKKFKVGSKTKARIIYAVPQDDGSRRVGFSLLDHILALTPSPSTLPEASPSKLKVQAAELDQILPSSSILDAKIVKVSPDRGLYITLPHKSGRDEQNFAAYAHISQIADTRIDTLSTTTGAFKPDSIHKIRILAYNAVDNTYYVSLKQSILDQAFLRIEDLPVGDIVKGTVDKLILGGARGVTGVLVKLSESITGLVPEMHFSDAQLQHPERKFKEGFPVKARILSVDMERRHVRLTLKKSLLEDDTPLWKAYEDLKSGMESKGTIVNTLANGAAVQFFGPVRAWLPVAEMSESFIENAEKHFRIGQTVTVRVLSVNAKTQQMKVTCKDSSEFNSELQSAWDSVTGGDLLSGTVTEKTADAVSIDLESGLRGTIRIGHLVDASAAKADGALKRIRVGQTLSNLLVLDKQDRSRTILLSNKSSMVEDAKAKKMITSFTDAQQGKKVHGFVRNLSPDGVYIEFTNGMVGLMPKSQISPDLHGQPEFGLRKDQTLNVWVSGLDPVRERFLLTMREQATAVEQPKPSEGISNAIDTTVKSMDDFKLGKVVTARIASVKATQINVFLADKVQGRVDVSEMFDSWEDIANKASPLQTYKANDLIDVKILGIHDARNHRFLPISHRAGKVPVFELSAKKSRIESDDESLLGLDTVKSGASHLAFVNNHGDNCVWVNLSPNVRGRVALMDLSDDVGELQNVENRFRIGCALRVKVKAVDMASNRLDLTARQNEASPALTFKDLLPGMVLPARVTRSNERTVTVELAENIICHVPLVELSDDYDQTNPGQYSKNDIVRASVISVDLPNKRVFVSLRPSKVLSSSLPVKDAQIANVGQLKAGDTVRGFVKKVAEKGIFVSLGASIDAHVRISDLSDQFVKEWRSIHEIDQLVAGRVLAVDVESKQVLLSLKLSHVSDDYKPPLSIGDLEAGMTVTGKVRKVEDFGVFIDIDNTQPRLSGLCHRSEVAAKRVEDVRKLYSAGDVVKAKVLDVNDEDRKISLGLKASYFDRDIDDADDDSEDEDVDMDGGVNVDENEDEDESESEAGVSIDLEDVEDTDSEDEAASHAMDVDETVTSATGGLTISGFDWNADSLDDQVNGAAYESEPETTVPKKKKRNAEIKEDLTGDLDKYGPRSNSDFERQLLGQANNSGLWIQYMAFQLQLGEIQKAREIAERALRTIHIREAEEKLNIWIAWMNLEVEYGDEDRVEEVFKQACEVQDPLEVHEKMASIFIDSGKHSKADDVFRKIVGNKSFRASPGVWTNYATFLMTSLRAASRARELLPKALQSVAINEHRQLTARFAALEFHSQGGDAERGRTIFEGLVSEWPKWSSGWDQWVDLERAQISRSDGKDAKKEAVEKTRALFERMAQQKTKKRRAKFVFKKWLEFEEKEGGGKQSERVKAMAKSYVEKMQATAGDEEDE